MYKIDALPFHSHNYFGKQKHIKAKSKCVKNVLSGVSVTQVSVCPRLFVGLLPARLTTQVRLLQFCLLSWHLPRAL